MAVHIARTKELSATPLRRDAMAVLEAGLRAIDTGNVIRDRVQVRGNTLAINGSKWDLRRYDHVYVIGIGKAAADACAALEPLLGSRLTDGIALDVKVRKMKKIKSIAGTHPFPSMENMRGTGEIIGLLKHVDSHDLVITVVSGGGSALLCWPYALKCSDFSAITRSLMNQGATIQELNTVRKHLSEILGGQFARLAYPADVIGLIFSDVPGDDIGVVASGPTVMDLTTKQDAARVLARYKVLKACKLPDCELKETPKDPLYFQHVTNLLVANNQLALAAMEAEGKRRGYKTRVVSNQLTGEASETGRMLAGLPEPGELVLAGGETTVTVRGNGTGGRNQELALGALEVVADDVLVASCASDGVDHSSAAGAIADARARVRATEKRLRPADALKRNDSFPFFEKIGSQLVTGITGANVSDLMIAMRAKG